MTLEDWNADVFRNWRGILCFACLFSSPVFCVRQDIFLTIQALQSKLGAPWSACLDDIIIACVLPPFYTSDLRRPVRLLIAAIGASFAGAGAAEATKSVPPLDARAAWNLEESIAQVAAKTIE